MQRLFLSLIITSIVETTATTAMASKQYQSSFTPNSNSVLIAETSAGQFVSVEHPTSGQVKIIEEDGARYLEIGEDFQSDYALRSLRIAVLHWKLFYTNPILSGFK